MVKQGRPAGRTASSWLSLLVLSASASLVVAAAGGADGGRDERRAAVAVGAAAVGDNVGSFFRRWAAPMADVPNVMAVDAREGKRQIARALERQQARRERRDGEGLEVVEVAAVVEVRATPAAGDAVAARSPRPAPVATPAPTPAPVLVLDRRQNDNSGQIAALSAQIQSLSLVASSFSQASRQVSQTSQQLAQSVTQLAQSTDRLSQSVQALQQSAQQASQSAQSAQNALQEATRSASSAISAAQQSAASSASAAIGSSLASITKSAADIVSAASASAINIAKFASSQVQAAQADATIARADAATQVQQAQGTAVSVTQAALAVVGTFIGTCLLTIISFYVVLRIKGKRRRAARAIAVRGDISYPRQQDRGGDDGGLVGEDAYGYPRDVKEVPRNNTRELSRDGDLGEYQRDAAVPRGANGGAQDAGYGLSLYDSNSGAGGGITRIGNPPPGRKGSAESAAAVGNGGTALSLFPKTPTRTAFAGNSMIGTAITSGEAQRQEQQQQRQQQQQQQDQLVSPSIYDTVSSAMTSSLAQAKSTANNPTQPQTSLRLWLEEGTVSPFGTLKRDNATGGNADSSSGSNWPFDRKQQQLRTMMKRTIGVGGVNAGGGSSRVTQPGDSLPLRRE